MISNKVGRRIRVLYAVNSLHGTIAPGWEGEVIAVHINGVGKEMWVIVWDMTGQQSSVYPKEVELL